MRSKLTHRIRYIILQGNLSEELFFSSLLCPSGSLNHHDLSFLLAQSSRKGFLSQPLTGPAGIQTGKFQHAVSVSNNLTFLPKISTSLHPVKTYSSQLSTQFPGLSNNNCKANSKQLFLPEHMQPDLRQSENTLLP
jgi:hypothetical protein